MRYYYLLLTQMVVLAFVAITSASAQSLNSPYIYKVYEYVPAPGQFINALPEWEEGDDAQAMADKCTELLAGEDASIICLGGFGGYVTFGFDHSVVNKVGEYDLYIKGNAVLSEQVEGAGSSEPGIVMVSQDTNGNGLPDDEWYELSGSADEDSIGKVTYNYEMTYTYSSLQDTPWTDNLGRSGVVPRNDFHKQEYFPMWLKDEPLTLTGTLLPKNGFDQSGNGSYWVMRCLRYGYVDNMPNLADGEKNPACCFNLDWAVDKDRKHVQLDYIDFVRVYSAENQTCGWLGETSTEVAGAEDLHPNLVPTGIYEMHNDECIMHNSYDLSGRRVGENSKGLIVKDGKMVIK